MAQPFDARPHRAFIINAMAKILEPGDKAPAISVLTDENKPFTLASLSGKQVVLYFYPKADTPG